MPMVEMKINYTMKNLGSLILFVFVLSFFYSCSRNDDPISEVKNYSHFVSAKEVKSYSKTDISAAFSLFANQYPDMASLATHVSSGVKVFYVVYKTKHTNNQEINVSGLVCIPQGNNEPLTLLSFQNGTNVKHASAPSKNMLNPEFIFLHAMAALGYVILIPDYTGFGASESYFHPYLFKSLFQSTITDFIKAVEEWEHGGDSGFALNGDLFLTGYSLGGWASLVTHRYIEQNPISGIKLIGSACGAGSYNLEGVQELLFHQTNYVQPFYIPFVIMGYKSVGALTGNLSLYFAEPYASRLPDLMTGAYSAGEINAQLSKNMSELLSPNMSANYSTDSKYDQLRMQLKDNSQDAWKNSSPIWLYHGTADVHVPFSISEDLYHQFQDLGQTENQVSFTVMQGKDHATGVMPMYMDVLNRLELLKSSN